MNRNIHFKFEGEPEKFFDFVNYIPYWMKIYTEFNLATWLRLAKFMELNISEFLFLYFNYISYH